LVERELERRAASFLYPAEPDGAPGEIDVEDESE
jgi:hypothetical protein